jgi:hypothetical protein
MIFPKITLRIERWKFNKEYGVYVSNLGNFKSKDKKDLRIKINNKGYCLVNTPAYKNRILAHRLVMLTWRPNLEAENLTVDHLDHNKRNNSVANLEWVTREENLLRAREDFDRGIVEPQVQKGPKKSKVITGIRVNNEIAPIDVEVIYNIMSKIYYKGGYPKAIIQKTIDELISGKNTVGSKKLGSKVTLTAVYGEV